MRADTCSQSNARIVIRTSRRHLSHNSQLSELAARGRSGSVAYHSDTAQQLGSGQCSEWIPAAADRWRMVQLESFWAIVGVQVRVVPAIIRGRPAPPLHACSGTGCPNLPALSRPRHATQRHASRKQTSLKTSRPRTTVVCALNRCVRQVAVRLSTGGYGRWRCTCSKPGGVPPRPQVVLVVVVLSSQYKSFLAAPVQEGCNLNVTSATGAPPRSLMCYRRLRPMEP